MGVPLVPPHIAVDIRYDRGALWEVGTKFFEVDSVGCGGDRFLLEGFVPLFVLAFLLFPVHFFFLSSPISPLPFTTKCRKANGEIEGGPFHVGIQMYREREVFF